MEEDKRGPDASGEDPLGGSDAQADAASPQEQAIRLAAEIETLKTENAELKDKSLRLIAEMENLRRRTERDKSEFAKYAISEFARDVVGVGDNIRRAIEAVPKEAVVSDPALSSLIEGVEVTERELLKVLERFQVKRFDPIGQPFNPHLHEAMTKIEVPNVAADTVVQVIHAGYMIDERVLRPAAVIVAKGSSKGSETPGPSGPGAQQAADEPIPPGAMKVPSDVVSSSDTPPQQPRGGRADVHQNVLGREFQGRRQAGGPGNDERAAPYRRQRGAGGEPFGEGRPQGLNKASALHKPVIGPGKE
ncbi:MULTISPECIES: nucleotide exchange factor GrpE [Rhodomicrobium]|uniref:nucleotide exchange factor GrpE n=1 Tax=Rhodomicrobium TaxID=1068 RepID=UPI000B4B9790|nr:MULTISPECIES: nucleotide exchange factor GrpE [Rhodomicrobium]